MLQSRVQPRVANCTTCGHPSIHPRIVKFSRGKELVTEAHWVCPRCSSKFMTGVINVETSEKK